MSAQFLSAKPVWLEGREGEVNCRVQFKTVVDYYDNATILLLLPVYISFG